MKHDFSFNDVIQRAKKAFKINDDKELAAFIGMSSNAFANRKKSQSLPFYELLAAADSQNVSFDWLLTGEGSMLKTVSDTDLTELKPDEEALLMLYRSTSAETRKEILFNAAAKERTKIDSRKAA